jgi:hypothetical protein
VTAKLNSIGLNPDYSGRDKRSPDTHLAVQWWVLVWRDQAFPTRGTKTKGGLTPSGDRGPQDEEAARKSPQDIRGPVGPQRDLVDANGEDEDAGQGRTRASP